MKSNVFIERMVCQHFKGGMYCTMYKSLPISPEEISNFDGHLTEITIVRDSEFDFDNVKIDVTTALEEQGMISIYLTEHGIFHNSAFNNHELAVYVSLETGEAYARPLDSFISPVDKEKYPDAIQTYRFQYISTSMKESRRTNVFFDKENEKVKANFGDGKIRVSNGHIDTPEGKIALLGISEAEDVKPIGSTRRASTVRDFNPDITLTFKKIESVDVVIQTLEECKLTLSK